MIWCCVPAGGGSGGGGGGWWREDDPYWPLRDWGDHPMRWWTWGLAGLLAGKRPHFLGVCTNSVDSAASTLQGSTMHSSIVMPRHLPIMLGLVGGCMPCTCLDSPASILAFKA